MNPRVESLGIVDGLGLFELDTNEVLDGLHVVVSCRIPM